MSVCRQVQIPFHRHCLTLQPHFEVYGFAPVVLFLAAAASSPALASAFCYAFHSSDDSPVAAAAWRLGDLKLVLSELDPSPVVLSFLLAGVGSKCGSSMGIAPSAFSSLLLASLAAANCAATGLFCLPLSSQDEQASGTLSRVSATVPFGNKFFMNRFALILSAKLCLVQSLFATDKALLAKLRFLTNFGTLFSLNCSRGTLFSSKGFLLLLFLLLFLFFSSPGAGPPAALEEFSFSTIPLCLLSPGKRVFWPLSSSTTFLLCSVSTSTVLAGPVDELAWPTSSGYWASTLSCCLSRRLLIPFWILSSVFSLDRLPLLLGFFLGAVLPKLWTAVHPQVQAPRWYPQELWLRGYPRTTSLR